MRATWRSAVFIAAWMLLVELSEIRSKEVCMPEDTYMHDTNYNDPARAASIYCSPTPTGRMTDRAL